MPFDVNVQKALKGQVVQEAQKLTNRELREKSLLSLARRFKPHATRALKTMVSLVEDPNTPPNVKYNASKFILEFSKELNKELYLDKYDDNEGQQIQEVESAPVFSLVMQKPANGS
jgi:2'-5' RNA ligase